MLYKIKMNYSCTHLINVAKMSQPLFVYLCNHFFRTSRREVIFKMLHISSSALRCRSLYNSTNHAFLVSFSSVSVFLLSSSEFTDDASVSEVGHGTIYIDIALFPDNIASIFTSIFFCILSCC